jgi:hypothetical protein
MDDASIFGIRDEKDFREKALGLFHEQARDLPVLSEFLAHLKLGPEAVNRIEEIPYLPVRFFKTHRVLREGRPIELSFRSSGTSEEQARAQHHVSDLRLYDRSWYEGFRDRYGDPASYRFLALLPSYSERGDASLVHMVQGLMETSGYPENGFFLHDHEALVRRLEELEERELPTVLIGVSFALLDLVEEHPMRLRNPIVMETGGMKGRRREMVREELHDRLKAGFGVDRIHSEYGMTELLSQAYAKSDGIFHPPPWMKVLAREIEDPFSILPPGRTGALNVIDLANRDSCAFLALDDLGRVHEDGSFEVVGRMDGSDVRGCNLMWTGRG